MHIIKHFFFQQIFFGRGISDYTYYTTTPTPQKQKIKNRGQIHKPQDKQPPF